MTFSASAEVRIRTARLFLEDASVSVVSAVSEYWLSKSCPHDADDSSFACWPRSEARRRLTPSVSQPPLDLVICRDRDHLLPKALMAGSCLWPLWPIATRMAPSALSMNARSVAECCLRLRGRGWRQSAPAPSESLSSNHVASSISIGFEHSTALWRSCLPFRQ